MGLYMIVTDERRHYLSCKFFLEWFWVILASESIPTSMIMTMTTIMMKNYISQKYQVSYLFGITSSSRFEWWWWGWQGRKRHWRHQRQGQLQWQRQNIFSIVPSVIPFRNHKLMTILMMMMRTMTTKTTKTISMTRRTSMATTKYFFKRIKYHTFSQSQAPAVQLVWLNGDDDHNDSINCKEDNNDNDNFFLFF